MKKLIAMICVGLVSVACGDNRNLARVDKEKECPGGFQEEPGLGCVKRLPNGNLLVHHSRGNQTEIHGGDSIAEEKFTHTDGSSSTTERPVFCASEPRVQVLYAYAAGSANRVHQVKSTIQTTVRTINGVFNREAVESGNITADLRVECDSDGQPSVTAVAVSDSTYSAIVSSVRGLGFSSNQEKYLIFTEFTSPGGYSGVGTFYSDDRKSTSNNNMVNPGYAITYGTSGGYYTPMHELGHNLGAVQFSAPDASGAGHCDGSGGQDVMCYNDGGPKWDSGHACVDLNRQHFDYCHNDFFDTATEPGEYLESYWNIGWTGNRFMRFGGGPPTPTSSTSTSSTSVQPPPPPPTTVPPTTTTTRRCFIFCF